MLITNAFVVFSITLIITKSKIMASKREFVELRYEAAKAGGQTPSFIHRWWHALMTCPMCSGFWVSIPICLLFPVNNWFSDILVVFGLNWILHCVENLMFYSGESFKELSESDLFRGISSANKSFSNFNNTNIFRIVEKLLKENQARNREK